MGARGKIGPQGFLGLKGERGDRGWAGPKGPQGMPGFQVKIFQNIYTIQHMFNKFRILLTFKRFPSKITIKPNIFN